MATKRSTRIRNGGAYKMEEAEKAAVGPGANNLPGTSGSQPEEAAGSLRRSSRTKIGTSGDAIVEEESEVSQNRSSNGKKSGSKVNSGNQEKNQRNDLMPDEIMAIFSNRGAGKRQPKIMTSVVLPSMIRMSGDTEDDDEDFHVQEEELEVESDSSGGPEDNDDDQQDEGKDSDESSNDNDSDESENDEGPRRKKRKVTKAVSNQDAGEDSSGDETGAKKNDSDEDESSDDDLTLVQTLDKFGQQAEQDKNRASHLICAVCLLTEGELDDYIVQCDKCGISVHEGCYGDPASGLDTDTQSESSDGSETEPWFCASCLGGLSAPPDCELCPSVGGIYRQTDDNNWIHIVCGLYIHSVSYGELERLENVCLQSVPSQLWGAKICAFCDDTRFARSGIALQCDAGLCKTYYHASCGQKMGFLAEAELREDGASKTVDIAAESPSVSFNFYSYCKLHSDPDIVKQRQRTYNLLQKQVSTFKSAMTGKVQRCFEKQSLKYLGSRKLVEAWYPDTPVPRLMSTRPALAKQLTRKAEMLGKLCDGVPTEFTVNITNKWHIQPAFNVNFVAYFQDRERRVKELQSSIVKNVRCNKQLKDELGVLEKKLRKITYIVDNMQKVIDKRVNQMIEATSHLRALTNLEYSLPITCTATLDLISKQPTAKKSSAAVKPKEEGATGKSSGATTNDGSIGVASNEKSADKGADDDNLFIVLNKCEVCKLRNNQHLLIECDSCKLHFHINCLDPPLSRVPKKGEKWLWQCRLCCPDTTKVEVFEDNLPRRRKKTVVYGREEEKAEKEKERDAPKKETPPESERKLTEKEHRQERKSTEPEKGILGPVRTDRHKSEDLLTVEKVPQIVSQKTPQHPSTKTDFKVFEFECSDTENENSWLTKDEQSQQVSGLEEKVAANENTIQPAPATEVKTSTAKSEEVPPRGPPFKPRIAELKSVVNSEQEAENEKVSEKQPVVSPATPKDRKKLTANDHNLLKPRLKEKETEEIPLVHEIELTENLQDEPTKPSNVIASTDEPKVSLEEVNCQNSEDNIVPWQGKNFMDQESPENKNNQEVKVPETLLAPPYASSSSSSSSSSSGSNTRDFLRPQLEKQDTETSSDSSSSSTDDDSFETVEPHPTTVDTVANQVIREEMTTKVDTRIQEQEQRSVTTSADSQDHNSDSSSSTSESGSIRDEDKGGAKPPKTGSASSDDTIVFGGSNKNRKTSVISESNYSDVCRKTTKDLHAVQKQLKESEKRLDAVTEGKRRMNEESSEANLSKLPKSSPQDFIAKWAKESGQNFTFDSSRKSSINTESDSIHEEFKTLNASSGARKVLSHNKTNQDAEKDKSHDANYQKVTAVEKEDKSVGSEFTQSAKPSAVPDKVTESAEEMVQYREITKISPEGEPIVVWVPIRKKSTLALQPEPKKPAVSSTLAPAPQPELKKSTNAPTKFKDPIIFLDNMSETVPLPSPTVNKAVLEKATKNPAQSVSKIIKHQEAVARAVTESNSSHEKTPFVIDSKDPLELFVPVTKPEKPAASLFIKDQAYELERKKKRKHQSIGSSPNKVPSFLPEKPQVVTAKAEENGKAKKPALSTPDFDQRDESDTLKEELYSNVAPAVIDKLSGKFPLDKATDVKRPVVESESVQNQITQNIRATNSIQMEITKEAKMAGQSEETSQDVKESKESKSQSGKPFGEAELERKAKASEKISKAQMFEKPSKSESNNIAAGTSTDTVQVSAPKQTKMSKVQLIDDLFGDFDTSGTAANSNASGNSKNSKQFKKAASQPKSDHEKKASTETEKTFRKVESSSYMPRSKLSNILPNEKEAESSKKTEQTIQAPQKDAKVKAAVDVSEQNLTTKRPSVQHFKIPKTKKTPKDLTTAKQEVLKEYGAVRSVEPKPKDKEAVIAPKPKDSGHRRIFGTNEPKKPVRQFPPAREFMKPKNPLDLQPSAKTGISGLPPIEAGTSPTFPTGPMKMTIPGSDNTFKEKLGQLMELGGSIVDDTGPVPGKFDDEEYDPTSNYKVDVANKMRKLSSSSGSSMKTMPTPSLPVPLPPPTGFSYEDFDYDNPPPPPPGLIGFDKVPKPKVHLTASGFDSQAKSSSAGIPPPIVMIPPGRASREGVRRAPSHEPIHVQERHNERVFPKSPSEMCPRPSQSTPQPKRKKDFQEYLQENRTKGHPHVSSSNNSVGQNFPPGGSFRRQESPLSHVNDEVFQVEDAGNFDSPTERKNSEDISRPGTPVLDESTDPLIIRSTDPNDPVVNPSEIPLSPNATVRIMQMLIDSNMIPGSSSTS